MRPFCSLAEIEQTQPTPEHHRVCTHPVRSLLAAYDENYCPQMGGVDAP